MGWHENITICERCPHGNADGSCRGPCPCRADQHGRDISALASLDCPIGKFAATEAPAGIEKLITGATGIAKALVGADQATPQTIERRTSICMSCDQAHKVAGLLQVCRSCGCALWAKLRLASEDCPLHKW